MTDLELKLPDDVMESIPSDRQEMIRHLAKYFDTVIDKYDARFQKRVSGAFGSPLSKYEKAILKDFLIDQTLGRIEETAHLAAESLSNK
jgi:hypothetical protein